MFIPAMPPLLIVLAGLAVRAWVAGARQAPEESGGYYVLRPSRALIYGAAFPGVIALALLAGAVEAVERGGSRAVLAIGGLFMPLMTGWIVKIRLSRILFNDSGARLQTTFGGRRDFLWEEMQAVEPRRRGLVLTVTFPNGVSRAAPNLTEHGRYANLVAAQAAQRRIAISEAPFRHA